MPSRTARRLIGVATRATAKAYRRNDHLPGLLALWPAELADDSDTGRLRIVARLHRALRSERVRGRAGHWTYDLNRHIALLGALKAEMAGLSEPERQGKCGPPGPMPGTRVRLRRFDGGEEIVVALVVACGDSAEVLEFVEQAFDRVVLPIEECAEGRQPQVRGMARILGHAPQLSSVSRSASWS